MEIKLSEVLSVSGSPGLFKYVAQSKGGIIVESLDESRRRTNISGSAKVSALGDIAIYTNSTEISLGEVLEMVFKEHKGEKVEIGGKSTPAELQGFMEGVLSDYDKDRVHNSDIKKLAQWYNILVGVGVTKFVESQEEAEVAEDGVAKAKVAAPKSAVAKKPATAVKAKSGTASTKSKVTATKSTTARKAQ